MVVNDAVRLVTPVPDSQYRLKCCGCGNDQPVYIQGLDGKWRVECLDCQEKTGGHVARHDAQLEWNINVFGAISTKIQKKSGVHNGENIW